MAGRLAMIRELNAEERNTQILIKEINNPIIDLRTEGQVIFTGEIGIEVEQWISRIDNLIKSQGLTEYVHGHKGGRPIKVPTCALAGNVLGDNAGDIGGIMAAGVIIANYEHGCGVAVVPMNALVTDIIMNGYGACYGIMGTTPVMGLAKLPGDNIRNAEYFNLDLLTGADAMNGSEIRIFEKRDRARIIKGGVEGTPLIVVYPDTTVDLEDWGKCENSEKIILQILGICSASIQEFCKNYEQSDGMGGQVNTPPKTWDSFRYVMENGDLIPMAVGLKSIIREFVKGQKKGVTGTIVELSQKKYQYGEDIYSYNREWKRLAREGSIPDVEASDLYIESFARIVKIYEKMVEKTGETLENLMKYTQKLADKGLGLTKHGSTAYERNLREKDKRMYYGDGRYMTMGNVKDYDYEKIQAMKEIVEKTTWDTEAEDRNRYGNIRRSRSRERKTYTNGRRKYSPQWNDKRKNDICNECGGKGHWAYECPNKKNRSRSRSSSGSRSRSRSRRINSRSRSNSRGRTVKFYEKTNGRRKNSPSYLSRRSRNICEYCNEKGHYGYECSVKLALEQGVYSEEETTRNTRDNSRTTYPRSSICSECRMSNGLHTEKCPNRLLSMREMKELLGDREYYSNRDNEFERMNYGGNNRYNNNRYSGNNRGGYKKKFDKSKITCYSCNKNGHYATEEICENFGKRKEYNRNNNYNRGNRKEIVCYNCGVEGHIVKDCEKELNMCPKCGEAHSEEFECKNR